MPPTIPAQQSATMPAQNIDFNAYTNKVRRIYDRYSSSSSSKEYDNAFDATSEIETIVKTIRKQAYNVFFPAKQDAINTIVEIALEMLDEGGSTLSSEIRKGYYWQTVGDAIEGILNLLSPKEMAALQDGDELIKELQQLKDSAREYGLDAGLDGAIKMLTGVTDGQDEDYGKDDGAQEDYAAGLSRPSAALQYASTVGQTAAAPLVVG